MSQIKRFQLVTLLFFFLFVLPIYSNDFKIQISSSVKQGEILSLNLSEPAKNKKISVLFLERETPCYLTKETGWECLIGIPADAPAGNQSLAILIDGSTQTLVNIEIVSCPFPMETLTLTQEKKSLLTQKGRDIEVKIIKEALRTESKTRSWDKKFLKPLEGKIESLYGEKRVLDGKPMAGFHRGLDIGAPKGTPIKSIHHGTVILASEFIEEGNMVMIDHGQGIISAYLHLSKILVAPGQKVGQGEPVGNVGSTGISTSPHLHFGAYIHSTPIDPLYLFNFP